MRVLSFGLVVVLALELAVWEAFLVAARPFDTAFPVAGLLAVLGNVVLGLVGARVLRSRSGAVIPGVIWLTVALTLGSGRAEGDRIVPDTVRGLAFLLLGTVAAAGVVGAVGGRSGGRATPEAVTGR